MKITPEDLSAYFAAKGVREECPMCGSPDWSAVPVAGPDGTIQAGEISFEILAQSIKSYSSIPVLPLTCQNCGFVRMHHTFWLMKWLAERDHDAN